MTFWERMSAVTEQVGGHRCITIGDRNTPTSKYAFFLGKLFVRQQSEKTPSER